jgi:hypothetical protein
MLNYLSTRTTLLLHRKKQRVRFQRLPELSKIHYPVAYRPHTIRAITPTQIKEGKLLMYVLYKNGNSSQWVVLCWHFKPHWRC